MLARLSELQIIKGGYFRALAEGNRIRRVPITAARGKILARGGEEIVGNSEVKKKVSFSPESGYEKKQVSPGSQGEDIISEWKRDYFLGSSAAHLSGYLGEANEDEVGKVDGSCPQKGPRTLGLLVGRSGLEAQYDCVLRGSDGEELVEVDTMGRKIRTIGAKEPVAGQDVKTHIDYKLQKKLAEEMQGIKGAAVISDVKGQILALYSSPSFDPINVADSVLDTDLPLFNRVIGGAYHPGSVFKLVTATGALEEGEVDKDFRYTDTGSEVIKADPTAEILQDYVYTNWYFTQYGRAEGQLDITRAIARSTDTFFYKLGEFLGVERLANWARKFGLDQKTQLDLPGEIVGLVPDDKWKRRVKGERWFLGNTYHMAIGQGDLALTPIEVNTMVAAVASGGKLCHPTIADGASSGCIDLGIKKENTDLVKEGMLGVCRSGGTAFPFFDFEEKTGIAVACKTGTAETDEEDKTHAWFVAFAPVDNPEIVMTVLVEKGGEGSAVAAPIARKIFDYYFNP